MNTSTYIPGRGFLYAFDPRAKILLLLLLITLFFLPITLAGLYLIVALIVAVGWHNTGKENVVRVFRSIIPMLIFMVLFAPLSKRGGEPLVAIGSFTLLSVEAVLYTLRLGGRFIGISYAATLLFATTLTGELILALRFWRLPYRAALVITLSFTYIPFIADSFEQISESHRLREASEEEQRPSIFRRLRDLIPTLTSVLVLALRSIPNVAMSLELRGLGRTEKRSSYHSLDSYTRLFTDLLISITIAAVLWLICRA